MAKLYARRAPSPTHGTGVWNIFIFANSDKRTEQPKIAPSPHVSIVIETSTHAAHSMSVSTSGFCTPLGVESWSPASLWRSLQMFGNPCKMDVRESMHAIDLCCWAAQLVRKPARCNASSQAATGPPNFFHVTFGDGIIAPPSARARTKYALC